MTTKHKDASRRNCDLEGFEHAEALYVDAVLSATKSRTPYVYYSFGIPALADALRVLCEIGIVIITIDRGLHLEALRHRQKNK